MTTEAPAAPAAPAAAPEIAAPEVPVGETPAPEVPVVEVPEKTFNQKELDEILEKRLSKERRKREDDRREKEYWRSEALKRSQQPDPKPAQEQPKPVDASEPKREQYDSIEAFIEARAEWRADQAVEKRFAKEREEAERTRTTEAQRKAADAFKARTKELAKDLPDFDEVMAEATSDPDSPVSRLFADPINECENPSAILYHLAKNADEAERIASLPLQKQAREIWALETKLKALPVKKPSGAPAPINPLGGKGGPSSDEPKDSDDITTWMKKERARQGKSKT